jgi:hypothetical protein
MKIKKFTTIISLIFLISFFIQMILQCNAASNPELFTHKRNITPFSTSGYVKLPMDMNIYSNMQNVPGDIRVFDSESKEIPYFIYSPLDIKNTSNIEAQVENKGLSQGDIVFTLSLFNVPSTINNISLDIAGNNIDNYVLKPSLQGSDDGVSWVDINTDSYLYKLQSKLSQSVNTIYTNPISFRFIKITLKIISGNVTPENIVKVYYKTQTTKVEPPIKNELSKIINTTVEGDRNSIIIDNGYNNSPMDKINFNITNSDYTRQVLLFGSHDQNKWDNISGSAEIYSLSVQKTLLPKTSIEIDKSRYRYIKATFINKDNIPLNLSSVDVFYYPEYLVFNSINTQSYIAYFGSYGLSKGDYQSGKLQDILEVDTLPMITWASEASNNTLYSGNDKPVTERNNYIFTIVIVLMVAILGWFIINSLKKLNVS